MKRIDSNELKHSLNGIKLYRDDLDYILDKFEVNDFAITLSDDENEYDSLEDVKIHKGESLKKLNIIGHNSVKKYDLIYIALNSTNVYVSSRGESTKLIFFEIIENLKKRKINPLFRFFLNARNAAYNFIFLITFYSGYFLYYKFILHKEYRDVKIIIFFLLFWAFSWLYSTLNNNTNGNIELKRIHESNFLKNNKKEIIIIIITIFLTFLSTYIIEKML